MRRHVVLLVLLICVLAAGCGEDEPTTPPAHAADGHQHADGEGHGHAHGDGPAPEDVPIVRYEEGSDEGPHHGVVARLSSASEPDSGWAEVKLYDDSGDLEVWLARDRAFKQSLDLPLETTLRIEFPERGDRHVTLGRDGRTNYFVFPGRTGAAAWLRGKAFRALVRVRVQAGRKVLVSDDFELRPHTH